MLKKRGRTIAKIATVQLRIKSALLALVLILAFGAFHSASAKVPCSGRFLNPISDICWKCIMPITIGPVKVGKGAAPSKRDRKNPSTPVCMCMEKNIPRPGIAIGFWEPARLIDVTRTPFCMTSLGGMQIGKLNTQKISSYNRSYSKHKMSHSSFYHVHYYVYPLIYWLELITDFICLEIATFDVAYLSELDPTWNDSKLQSLLNPEAALFANPLAQAACSIDCGKSTYSMPSDMMFWCAGCWGNLYPFSGSNADHVGGVQNSSLLSARILAKMHRVGLAKSTSTSNGSINGPLCKKSIDLSFKKSQYKLQMTYPKPTKGAVGCWPIGLTDLMYSKLKEYPYDGQDWGYLVWRKRNCCAF